MIIIEDSHANIILASYDSNLLMGEVGLEPTMFLCHGFTDRYLRRWVTLPYLFK